MGRGEDEHKCVWGVGGVGGSEGGPWRNPRKLGFCDRAEMGGDKDTRRAGACGLGDIDAGVFMWRERKVNPPLTRTKCQGPLMLWRQEEACGKWGGGRASLALRSFLFPPSRRWRYLERPGVWGAWRVVRRKQLLWGGEPGSRSGRRGGLPSTGCFLLARQLPSGREPDGAMR